MPSTLIAAVWTGVRSAVSSATTAPPMESPTNSTPSGPNASAPADFNSALPGVSVAAALTDSRIGETSAVSAVARHNPSAARTAIRYCILPPQKEENRPQSRRPSYARARRRETSALAGTVWPHLGPCGRNWDRTAVGDALEGVPLFSFFQWKDDAHRQAHGVEITKAVEHVAP